MFIFLPKFSLGLDILGISSLFLLMFHPFLDTHTFSQIKHFLSSFADSIIQKSHKHFSAWGNILFKGKLFFGTNCKYMICQESI